LVTFAAIVDPNMTGTKGELRRQLIRARRAVTPAVRGGEDDALIRLVGNAVTSGETVCAYAPVGGEPGSVAMLDALAAKRIRLLLPLARRDGGNVPLPLSWAEYRPGELVSAALGLLEPVGPVLEPHTIAQASTVFVPALAADRHGVRLGRGAGYYDRTLHLAASTARLIAVIRDDELFDELPAEPHDIRMTHVLTPLGGLLAIR
jgi:5-formyltetrahydrofolate cyclo-ligase